MLVPTEAANSLVVAPRWLVLRLGDSNADLYSHSGLSLSRVTFYGDLNERSTALSPKELQRLQSSSRTPAERSSHGHVTRPRMF